MAEVPSRSSPSQFKRDKAHSEKSGFEKQLKKHIKARERAVPQLARRAEQAQRVAQQLDDENAYHGTIKELREGVVGPPAPSTSSPRVALADILLRVK